MVDVQHYLITKHEAAELLGKCERSFRRICNRGEIQPVLAIGGNPHKPGRRLLRFSLDDVLMWKREHGIQNEDGHPCEEQPPEKS